MFVQHLIEMVKVSLKNNTFQFSVSLFSLYKEIFFLRKRRSLSYGPQLQYFLRVKVELELRAFPGKSIWVGWNWPELFSSWCWGSESFRFLGGGGEAYFSFLGGRVKFEK